MEIKVNHLNFAPDCYSAAVDYFQSQKPNESLVVFFGERRLDSFRPGWYWYDLKWILIPDESDYLTRTPSFIKMSRDFHDKIKGSAEKTGLKPLVFDHCQPIDVPSTTDAVTTRRVAEYYQGSVMGSYNNFHRFFRLSNKSLEMITWKVDDEIYARQRLAFGEEDQYKVASARVLIVGVGGIGWKIAVDLALMGVGQIDLVDPDIIECSNLSRIPLPRTSIGERKTEELRQVLEDIRPNLVTTIRTTKIQELEPSDFEAYDVVIVTTDNTQSRLYCNDVCLEKRVPCIQVGASLENGMKSISCRTVQGGFTPCYECWKTFTVEELRRDFYTEDQKRSIQRGNYGLPSAVPSIVYVNTVAAGIAEDAFLRLIANKETVSYVYIDLNGLTMKTYSRDRDPECRACSNIPDHDVAMLQTQQSTS
jgi:molybdopterin/thiamine biosynthesis adenylyltransferase